MIMAIIEQYQNQIWILKLLQPGIERAERAY